MCSASRDLFKFRKITDNIVETGRYEDINAMEY